MGARCPNIVHAGVMKCRRDITCRMAARITAWRQFRFQLNCLAAALGCKYDSAAASPGQIWHNCMRAVAHAQMSFRIENAALQKYGG
jgi:hypothetical protein